SSPVAVTVAVYSVPYPSGSPGTHELPSARISPAGFPPLPSASSTVSILPFVTFTAFSAVTGPFVAPSAGPVTSSATCPGPGEPGLPPSLPLPDFTFPELHPATATSPAIATRATALRSTSMPPLPDPSVPPTIVPHPRTAIRDHGHATPKPALSDWKTPRPPC